MLQKIPLNIPNLLSLYRLFSFPFILYIALIGNEKWFAILLCINLITDILDGLIARMFNLKTDIGAKLDSIADNFTYLLAFIGIYLFKSIEFGPHIITLGIFISLFVLCNVFSLLKFGEFPSMHLYSWKIGGYIQGFFFFVLFLDDFYTPFYYFMITWGILSFIEHLVIQIISKEMISNRKGLYWVLRSK